MRLVLVDILILEFLFEEIPARKTVAESNPLSFPRSRLSQNSICSHSSEGWNPGKVQDYNTLAIQHQNRIQRMGSIANIL